MRSRLMVVGVGIACVYGCLFAGAPKRGALAARAGGTVSTAGDTNSAQSAPLDKITNHRAHGATNNSASGDASDESQIRAVLTTQTAAWNRGDIDSFMKYYWRSDKTLFVGVNGVTRGWQAVLDRYHRSYPDRKAMGHLTFSNIEVQQDCARAAVVIGEYHLRREKDNPSGVFTLNFRKFPDGWRIVVDHTTAFPSHKSHK